LSFVLLLAFRRRELADLGMLAGTAGLGLLANAFVCGVFSGPHDRYGARMVWIATFVVAIAAARLVPLVDWRALFAAPMRLHYARRRIPPVT
jgi:predicted membrane protein